MTQSGFGDMTNLADKLMIHVIMEQYKQFAYKSNQKSIQPSIL